MSESEIEWLPSEVIQELLAIDEDSDCPDAVGDTVCQTVQSSVCEGSSGRNNDKDPAWLLDELTEHKAQLSACIWENHDCSSVVIHFMKGQFAGSKRLGLTLLSGDNYEV